MTAEDFLQEHLEISHFYLDKYEQTCCFSADVQKAMREFAELKCKELLEIVAEKAKTRKEYYDPFIEPSIIVDKDSILNAVNLKEFIQ